MNNIAEENNSLNTEQLPWLIFRLDNQQYAINCEAVASISLAPEHPQKLPGVRKEMVGVFVLRDSVVPLLSLRELFNKPRLSDEFAEFSGIMDARKQDHIHWVNELKKAYDEHREFTLTDNPHECAFGRWYDSYQPPNHSVAFYLKKLEEPHKTLHGIATQYNAALKSGDAEAMEDMEYWIDMAENELMPEILATMDDAKNILKQSYRESAVIMEYCGHTMAILVDSVVGIAPLHSFEGFEDYLKNDAASAYYIEGAAKRKNFDDVIIKLNYEKLLECLGC